jgi:hypothetical protein
VCGLAGVDTRITHRRFLHSATFVGWFRERYRNVVHKLRLLHLDVLCTADLRGALQTNSLPDVQLVDLMMKLSDKMVSGSAHVVR